MSSYARFYRLLNLLPVHDDEMKERLVRQYTGRADCEPAEDVRGRV